MGEGCGGVTKIRIMIRIILSLAFWVFSIHIGFTQWIDTTQIFGIDSCKFDSIPQWVKLDTSSQNIWQVGIPQKTFFDSAYSISKAIVTDTVISYDTSVDSYFEITIPLSFYLFDVLVDFQHKFQTDTLRDGGRIEVSYDKGVTWQNIIEDTLDYAVISEFENMYETHDTLYDGSYGFSGLSDDWQHTRLFWIWAFPLKMFPDDMSLRFYFISDTINTNKEGWMIDDIVISYVDLGSGISEKSSNSKISLSPNPAQETIRIQFLDPNIRDSQELKIYSITGQLVLHQMIYPPESEINIETLESGVYMYAIGDQRGKIVVE